MRILIVTIVAIIVASASFAEAQSRSFASTRRNSQYAPRCERSYNVYNDYSINRYYGQPYYSRQRFPNDRYYDYYDQNRGGYSYAPGVGSSSYYDVRSQVQNDPYAHNRLLGQSRRR